MSRKPQDLLDTRAVEIAAAATETAQHALAAVNEHQRDCTEYRRETRAALVEAAKESRAAHKELMDKVEPIGAWMNRLQGQLAAIGAGAVLVSGVLNYIVGKVLH